MTQLGHLETQDFRVTPGDRASLSEPPISPPARIADTFVRTEDKYLVPCDLYGFFVDQLEMRMSPSYPNPDTRYTFIESRYYDSHALRFFQDHFQSLPLRHKLRVRRYGPNGQWQNEPPHLELKTKQKKVSKKERFRVGYEDLRCISLGDLVCPTASLRETNRGMDEAKLYSRICKVNYILDEVAPRPICAIRYARRAFERDGVRVTVDSSLRTELIGCLEPDTVAAIYEGPRWERMQEMGRKIQNDDHFLLEIKHSGTGFDWLDELVQTYELRKTRFSKYCYAMTGFIAAFRDAIL